MLPKIYLPNEEREQKLLPQTLSLATNWLGSSGDLGFSSRSKGLVQIESHELHQSSFGVSRKPIGCANCSYRNIGAGFVPDYLGDKALIAICLEAPGEEEYLRSTPLVGKAGRYWLRKLIEPLGYGREDCLICNVLRCRPPNNVYPTGKIRKDAETRCRQYDDKLARFRPSMVVVTLHPSALLRSSAATRLVKRDIEKTFNFAKEGYRPLLLMGEKALETFTNFRGIKKWRGMYIEINDLYELRKE